MTEMDIFAKLLTVFHKNAVCLMFELVFNKDALVFSELNVMHCIESVCIRSYSGPHFPTFGLNTGKCIPEYLRIRTPFTQ